MPLLLQFPVPHHFRYPVWGQEPGSLMHKQCRVLTQKLIFSPAYYYDVRTSGNVLKCHIISAGLSLIFTDQSVYFYISKLQLEL